MSLLSSSSFPRRIVGLVMYICYNLIYLRYSDINKRKAMVLYYFGEVLFLAALICITILVFHSHTSRSNFVGIFCDVFGIILYGSPLTVMFKVVKTKSVKFMPLSLSLAGFFNGIIWSAYAFIRFDPYILIGNGVGAILGCIQLILYACYYGSTPKKGEEPPKQSPVQISAV
ncbi:hypothetical protein BVRB_1g019690 [Beta vulgaris subsp. vulgaris]|nr:hypothetical protein BVRB_1g019690 [Beta vulgaris subsp. vulgaris]